MANKNGVSVETSFGILDLFTKHIQKNALHTCSVITVHCSLIYIWMFDVTTIIPLPYGWIYMTNTDFSIIASAVLWKTFLWKIAHISHRPANERWIKRKKLILHRESHSNPITRRQKRLMKRQKKCGKRELLPWSRKRIFHWTYTQSVWIKMAKCHKKKLGILSL